MKALSVTAPKAAQIVEVDRPKPPAGEILVKVSLVDTCPQWDLHLAHNVPMFVGHKFFYPYTLGQPGHEMVGTVAELGEGVTDFVVGQRVAAWRDQGHDRQGCYAEYVNLIADNALPVPDGLADEQVASLELAMCQAVAFLPCIKLDAIAGRVCAVNGSGPAGLIAGQICRAEGASKVIGFEPNAERRAFATGYAVDEAYDSNDPATIAKFPTRWSGIGFGIDCCGFPGAVRFLMDRVLETVALFAVQRDDYTYAVGHAGLNVMGYGSHNKVAAQYAMDLIAAGKIDLRPLVSEQMPLSDYLKGVELLEAQKAIKIGFRP